MATDLKFGTSGLRGLVTELAGLPAWAYTMAFLNVLAQRGRLQPGDSVCVGRDLRQSSPEISGLVCRAIADAGFTPVDCGECPTPALSLYAFGRQAPAIMVTGSHIPEDRNGLKFYRADGEIDKDDELAIVAAHEALQAAGRKAGLTTSEIVSPLSDYAARYENFFGGNALAGLKIGVYQHSSVMREVAVDILRALGAVVTPLGWSGTFVPVDTEAVHPDDIRRLKEWSASGGYDAIISSDGDADRPLIADENGDVVRGDAIGALTAAFLGADAIVTPVTSNSALEQNLDKAAIVRTKVGSPFVIAGINSARKAGKKVIVGFEANGGLILGSDVIRNGRTLKALPTRDAVLPILACLSQVAARREPLSRIVGALGFRAAVSNRLQNVPQSATAGFLAKLSSEGAERREIVETIGQIKSMDTVDGVRFLSDQGEVLFYRASGNAPELRCYVEAQEADRANSLLDWGLDFARRQVTYT